MAVRLSFSAEGRTPFTRLLGHNPEVLKHWVALEETFFTATGLPSQLLHNVRAVLAAAYECPY